MLPNLIVFGATREESTVLILNWIFFTCIVYDVIQATAINLQILVHQYALVMFPELGEIGQ